MTTYSLAPEFSVAARNFNSATEAADIPELTDRVLDERPFGEGTQRLERHAYGVPGKRALKVWWEIALYGPSGKKVPVAPNIFYALADARAEWNA